MKNIKTNSFLVISALFLCVLTALSVNAATFTVNSNLHTPDTVPGDGICTDASGFCTLRAAIQEANALAGADAIDFDATVFASAQTILLTDVPLPPITDNLTITGTSPALLTIDGDENFRIFLIEVNVTVAISNLTAANAYAGESVGAGILNAGNLTVTNLVIRNNTIAMGLGGGIYNTGTLTVVDSSIYDNNALGSFATGIGIANFNGSVSITNSVIRNNVGTSFGVGGGISNDNGSIIITNSVISGNSAPDGAGIYNFRNPPIKRSKNIAGIITGLVNITNSTVSDNIASDNGGGIFNDNGEVNITSSTIGSSTVEGSNRAANGGGIYNLNGAVTLNNSTISGNFSSNIGGGYYGFGDFSLTTLNSNSSTIAFNTAINGGGIAVSSLSGFNSTATIANTIISNNNAATGPDVSDNTPVGSTIISTGYNIVQNTDGATITPLTGDQFGTNPLLLPLADYGGPTATHALNTGSPAIDQGNSPFTSDQRGFQRPVDNPSIPPAPSGNNSDIGSFEVQAATAAFAAVEGRVISDTGRGISKAVVRITDGNGNRRSVLTGTFGHYRFDGIEVGQTVIIEVTGKGIQTQPVIIEIFSDVYNLDFVLKSGNL